MISYETPYRVCYADTDRMGIMYYGNYPGLYEIGRTDMIRTIWKSYPKPANYDELLTIRTIIKEIPKVKFRLISEIYNKKMELINEGEVTLGFMDAASGKPRRAPAEFTEILERTGKFG